MSSNSSDQVPGGIPSYLLKLGNGDNSNGSAKGGIPFQLSIWMAIAAFTAVAWYNVIELNISVYLTFKRKKGLYFWSLVVSSWGIICHSTGFLVKLLWLNPYDMLSLAISTSGWWFMVTGQALVLYSRLHLVVKEERILRGTLIMILTNAVVLHIPTSIFTFGSASNASDRFTVGYNIIEKIQMTIFCMQEFIISGIYLWATVRLLKPVYRRRTRSVMTQLIWINVLIIIMDIALLVVEYRGYYGIETTLKGMVYSIKLKLEFAVLNQLMRLANSTQNEAVLTYDENGRNNEEPEKPRSKPMRMIRKFLPGRNPFHDEETSHYSSSIAHPSVHQRQLAEARAASMAAAKEPSMYSKEPMSPRSTTSVGQSSALPPYSPGQIHVATNTSVVWSPNLNRHQKLSENYLENVQARERDNSVSTIYNNPAAFYPSSAQHHRDPLDPLGTITSADSSPRTSLDEARNPQTEVESIKLEPRPTTSAEQKDLPPIPVASKDETTAAKKRGQLPRLNIGQLRRPTAEPPAPQLAKNRESGLLQSSRASVNDWMHSSSEGGSRASSEARLEPAERPSNDGSPLAQAPAEAAEEKMRVWSERNKKQVEAEAARGGRANGLEFMTSAL